MKVESARAEVSVLESWVLNLRVDIYSYFLNLRVDLCSFILNLRFVDVYSYILFV